MAICSCSNKIELILTCKKAEIDISIFSNGHHLECMIDYCSTSSKRHFGYIQDENTHDRLPLTNIWSLVGMNFCLQCTPTLFRNLQKRSLVCSERGTL